jgi:hypothetical protein
MNKQAEKAVIQVLVKSSMSVLLVNEAEFTEFTNQEAILAAFIDGKLSPQQTNRVKTELASNPTLRQQWQHCLQAKAVQANTVEENTATNQQRPRDKLIAFVGLAASIAVVTMLFVQTNTKQPGTLASNVPKPPVLLEAQTTPTAQLANSAVPVSAWQSFIATYNNGAAPIANNLSREEQQFAQLAKAALAVENTNCLTQSKAALQASFEQLALQYPIDFERLTPRTEQQWCQTGKLLQQYVKQSVLPIER